MKNRINSSALLKRNSQQLFSEVDGEVVMLSISNGEYYSFDSISTEIWNFLDKPKAFSNLIGYLLEAYEVNEETCINDTNQILDELIGKGLVEIINE